MKKLLLKSLLFCLPFTLYGLTVFVIDPFNYFNVSHVIRDDIKERISHPMNYRLWRMVEYRRRPVDNILLGDSRMMNLNTDQIENLTGEEYFNFALGGGSLFEAIETFWYANNLARLKHVYVGVNFNLFNKFYNVNQARHVKQYFDNPFLYLTDKVVFTSGLKLLQSTLFGSEVNVESSGMSHDEFWRFQLDVSATRHFAKYKYPDKAVSDLRAIASYCDSAGIELAFVVFPEHQSLHQRIEDFNLASEYARFNTDLREIAHVYDFNHRSEMTQRAENFRDPYHSTDEICSQLVDSIWRTERVTELSE